MAELDERQQLGGTGSVPLGCAILQKNHTIINFPRKRNFTIAFPELNVIWETQQCPQSKGHPNYIWEKILLSLLCLAEQKESVMTSEIKTLTYFYSMSKFTGKSRLHKHCLQDLSI